jgi:hypothetical protein
MAYIFEMASGAEYLGDELRVPRQSPASRTPPSPTHRQDHQVQLRLASIDMAAPQERAADFSAEMDLGTLIGHLTDQD